MGALDEGHFNGELDNGVQFCCHESGFEEEPETVSIKKAVKVLLHGLSEDVDREGIRKTPLRVAKALREGTRGYEQKVKDIVQGALFPEAGVDNTVGQAGGAGGLVVVRDLDLFSYCESCLLPFQVKCHVGYVPSGQRVVGLSKLSRVADVFAKRLQDPQRLADEVCSALHHGIKPAGVAVVLQCRHLRFPDLESLFLPSGDKGWVKSQVFSGSGVFEQENSDSWVDFMSLLKFRGVSVDKSSVKKAGEQSWCPSLVTSRLKTPANQAMVTAVSSMLRSLGEDPTRKELLGTPCRFVHWLMNFQNVKLEMKLNGSLSSTNESPSAERTMQSELNLPFWSQCEHHLLPFHGVVHVGSLSAEALDPIRKSLVQSIVHFYGFKLQVQERLTKQIAETVSTFLGSDVIVVVEASHTCMLARGIEKFGSSTATIAVLGRFSTDSAARALFLQGVPCRTRCED